MVSTASGGSFEIKAFSSARPNLRPTSHVAEPWMRLLFMDPLFKVEPGGHLGIVLHTEKAHGAVVPLGRDIEVRVDNVLI